MVQKFETNDVLTEDRYLYNTGIEVRRQTGGIPMRGHGLPECV